jgi:uncharacterized protein (DUF1015 family)
MANLFPIRAYRYNKRVISRLDQVFSQPYDKISLQMQEEYYRRSPHNVVHITKSLEKNQDPETDYPQAGATLQRWIEEQVLIRDSEPGIYPYYQEYKVEGERKIRKGFIALLDLQHSAGILPHERTMAEPRMDRLRLLRSTECNDDLIFMLYTDVQMVVNRILDEWVTHAAPEIEVDDDLGARHKVWAITDPAAIKKVRDAMVPEELFIADGHHRYETALNYMKECLEKGWRAAGVESFDKRLVACFNSADEGITILPTHRLVRSLSGFDSRNFLNAARQYFDCDRISTPETLWSKMREERGINHIFGFYPGDTREVHALRLKEGAKLDPLLLAHGEAYGRLDVSILHTLILDRLLGIDEAKLVAQAHVDYARDRDACLRRVDEGKYQTAFFLNPTTVEQVQRVALSGEKMPQKSTDFYPKLLTGLLFMKMQISKRPDGGLPGAA